MSLLPRFRTLLQRDSSVVEERPSQPLDRILTISSLEVGGSYTSNSSSISLSRRYAQMAQDLKPSMPSTCRWLKPEDVKLVGEHQITAGGFADIWQATHDGRKVVLKSYRCYMTFDVARVVARFRDEVHVHSLLCHRGVDVVPLVGVYSTETHPFGLVYEYMEGLDLRQYLNNEPNAGRLKLLTGIARCLNRIHDLEIVHGDLRTANILVDKDGNPHIAGLGNTYILPHPTARTVDGGAGTERYSPSRASGLAGPHSTKAGDIYAFGVMAFEVLTGRPPFSEMTEIAATYLMLSGARPPRPSHPEISDRLWHMVERCWDNVPSERMPTGEAINLLETELQRTSNPCTLYRA